MQDRGHQTGGVGWGGTGAAPPEGKGRRNEARMSGQRDCGGAPCVLGWVVWGGRQTRRAAGRGIRGRRGGTHTPWEQNWLRDEGARQQAGGRMARRCEGGGAGRGQGGPLQRVRRHKGTRGKTGWPPDMCKTGQRGVAAASQEECESVGDSCFWFVGCGVWCGQRARYGQCSSAGQAKTGQGRGERRAGIKTGAFQSGSLG